MVKLYCRKQVANFTALGQNSKATEESTSNPVSTRGQAGKNFPWKRSVAHADTSSTTV